jgi:hypothetical protein
MESKGEIWNIVNILKALQPYYVFFFHFLCREMINAQIDFQGVGDAIERATRSAGVLDAGAIHWRVLMAIRHAGFICKPVKE